MCTPLSLNAPFGRVYNDDFTAYFPLQSISTLEEYAEPFECAPQIVKQLPTVIHSQERELTKLEVKVHAHPKPQIRWLKAGEEIIPSDEFQIENFDDGTSILIINDIYPDDSGEITFEAHNALGVAMTTTELVVEGILIGHWSHTYYTSGGCSICFTNIALLLCRKVLSTLF